MPETGRRDSAANKVVDDKSKKGGGTPLQQTEAFFQEMLMCNTRSQKWDFLYATEYVDDSLELNEAMAAMTDEQVESWFPTICAEFFCKNISKTL